MNYLFFNSQSAPSSTPAGLASHALSSLLSGHFTSASVTAASILPRPLADTQAEPSYHPAAFASYQNSLKLKKKKHRTTKIGPDGIPLKRKSREGGTTYLWEFLLKLLQVCFKDSYYDWIFLGIVYTEYILLGQRELSKVHQVGQQGEGHLQAGGQQGGLQALGAPQEQAGHELRDHGPSTEVTDQSEKSLNRQEIIFYTCLYFPSLDITTSAAS